MLKKLVIFVFAFTLIFVIDQVVKNWTMNTLCLANQIDKTSGKILMSDGVMDGQEIFVEVAQCAGKVQGEFISLVGTINTGVAFSMFSGFTQHLKFVHLGLLVALLLYLLWQRRFFAQHLFAFALLFGAGCSNLFDRFVYGGVIDMFFWHKWFEFAVFNVADATINLSIFIIILGEIVLYFKNKKPKQDEWMS